MKATPIILILGAGAVALYIYNKNKTKKVEEVTDTKLPPNIVEDKPTATEKTAAEPKKETKVERNRRLLKNAAAKAKSLATKENVSKFKAIAKKYATKENVKKALSILKRK